MTDAIGVVIDFQPVKDISTKFSNVTPKSEVTIIDDRFIYTISTYFIFIQQWSKFLTFAVLN